MLNTQIKNLALGMTKEYHWKNKDEPSAIDKTAVARLELKKTMITGDEVAHPDFHGGEDRVVCLYPFEHYAKWEKEFHTNISLPAFGENITCTGMLEQDVCIGDIFQIGNAIIQVTQGRVPCSTISKFNGIDQFLSRVFATGLTGYFFRVLEEGVITMDSTIKLVEPHPLRVSVLYANQTLFHDQRNLQAIEKILEVQELAEVWRGKLMKLHK